MPDRLISLLSDSGGSPLEKLRALGREAMESLKADYLEIRVEGIGEVRLGETVTVADRRPIGPASRPLGEWAASCPNGGDPSPFIHCAEILHRLQAGHVDGLTGLYNRRRLDLELAGLHLAADTAALVMLDIDHFKRVNDDHGHDAGDAVLRAFGARLLAALPENTFLARYGGEEFCLILPGADEAAGARIADELRGAGTSDPVKWGPQWIRFTSSAGVAAGDSARSGDLLRQADEALYAAKEGGRNIVVKASDIRRRRATGFLKRRFRKILNRPIYDLAWCGQRVAGLDQAASRMVYIDYFGGVIPIGEILDGAHSVARAGRRVFWAGGGQPGLRIGRGGAPAATNGPAGIPDLRRVQADLKLRRLYLISQDGVSLHWTDYAATRAHVVSLPAAPACGITAVLPVGPLLLVLDALGRRIVVLDRDRLTLKTVWPLPDEAYELCLSYLPELKLLLLGGAEGMKFLSFEGAVEERSDQPVISAYAHPLVGLAISTPDETYLVR
ncbi:GGDEF domain-containing protein [bacterium]|nr:GGDEF domain-containing protein [bacterium]